MVPRHETGRVRNNVYNSNNYYCSPHNHNLGRWNVNDSNNLNWRGNYRTYNHNNSANNDINTAVNYNNSTNNNDNTANDDNNTTDNHNYLSCRAAAHRADDML